MIPIKFPKSTKSIPRSYCRHTPHISHLKGKRNVATNQSCTLDVGNLSGTWSLGQDKRGYSVELVFQQSRWQLLETLSPGLNDTPGCLLALSFAVETVSLSHFLQPSGSELPTCLQQWIVRRLDYECFLLL